METYQASMWSVYKYLQDCLISPWNGKCLNFFTALCLVVVTVPVRKQRTLIPSPSVKHPGLSLSYLLLSKAAYSVLWQQRTVGLRPPPAAMHPKMCLSLVSRPQFYRQTSHFSSMCGRAQALRRQSSRNVPPNKFQVLASVPLLLEGVHRKGASSLTVTVTYCASTKSTKPIWNHDVAEGASNRTSFASPTNTNKAARKSVSTDKPVRRRNPMTGAW